ncbi:unnamed protein product [Coffea canephora]|uniref:DH200=94 genomic scaffold, scaffold_159 n=1 Tax=Coffea canephora TaxID=49390 RepID=A0A068V9G9_COFCA|nr:unnamed protein product [Coffea canephora]
MNTKGGKARFPVLVWPGIKDFEVRKSRWKQGSWLRKKYLNMRVGSIIIHFLFILFRASVFLSSIFLLNFVLGSEGTAIMTRGNNLFFFGILLFCFGLLFRIFYIKQKKRWIIPLFRFFLFLIIYIYIYYLRIFLVAHLGAYVNWALPFVILGVSGKEILVHSETSSSSSWREDSFEMRVLLEPFPEEGTSVNPTRVAADEAGSSAPGGLPDLNQPAPHSPEPVAPEIDLNQPAPHSPEPVAPEVDQPDGGGPLIPELPNPLIPDDVRMEELEKKFSFYTMIDKKCKLEDQQEILASQIVIEKRVEEALVSDGFNSERILAKRSDIRSFMFYPHGKLLSKNTYLQHAWSIDNLGTRDSVPYERVIKAIKSCSLSLDNPP